MNTSIVDGCVLMIVCAFAFMVLVFMNGAILFFPVFLLFSWVGIQAYHQLALGTILVLSFLFAIPEAYFIDHILTKWRVMRFERREAKTPAPPTQNSAHDPPPQGERRH
jgi:hypothetical protein